MRMEWPARISRGPPDYSVSSRHDTRCRQRRRGRVIDCLDHDMFRAINGEFYSGSRFGRPRLTLIDAREAYVMRTMRHGTMLPAPEGESRDDVAAGECDWTGGG